MAEKLPTQEVTEIPAYELSSDELDFLDDLENERFSESDEQSIEKQPTSPESEIDKELSRRKRFKNIKLEIAIARELAKERFMHDGDYEDSDLENGESKEEYEAYLEASGDKQGYEEFDIESRREELYTLVEIQQELGGQALTDQDVLREYGLDRLADELQASEDAKKRRKIVATVAAIMVVAGAAYGLANHAGLFDHHGDSDNSGDGDHHGDSGGESPLVAATAETADDSGEHINLHADDFNDAGFNHIGDPNYNGNLDFGAGIDHLTDYLTSSDILTAVEDNIDSTPHQLAYALLHDVPAEALTHLGLGDYAGHDSNADVDKLATYLDGHNELRNDAQDFLLDLFDASDVEVHDYSGIITNHGIALAEGADSHSGNAGDVHITSGSYHVDGLKIITIHTDYGDVNYKLDCLNPVELGGDDGGDHGETGDSGEQNETGETGESGERGETGDSGEENETGETGDSGEQGETGVSEKDPTQDINVNPDLNDDAKDTGGDHTVNEPDQDKGDGKDFQPDKPKFGE
ncbi:MAG: hypothetical protein LBG75_02460 [Candidatus Nomurabacteria bacterium]|jgi:hypothetical protein|nr:hypothetical protein [Candidatus Nomurabacteria bacterium]